MQKYDLVIIGSGPGGYIAALYASQKKLRVAVIEKDLLGGTCLNRGCIPTKTLIRSAHVFSLLKSARKYGIETDACRINFREVMARKDEVVNRLRGGIQALFRARKIDLFAGEGHIVDSHTVGIDGVMVEAGAIIIAAGSRAAEIERCVFNHSSILTSDDLLSIANLPQSLTVVGGGVIGCEFAQLFHSFGTKVTLVELTDRILPEQSREVSRKFEQVLKRSGIDIRTSAMITEAVPDPQGVRVSIKSGDAIHSEKVLIAVGRKAELSTLGDFIRRKVMIENGRICVSDTLETDLRGVYAIGDCVSGPQLAHKASYDAMIAVDAVMGVKRARNYSAMPSTVWTEPQIASVGVIEEAARAQYADIRVAKFPYLASGKAVVNGSTEGLVRIVSRATGEVVGVEIFGDDACELIAEATLAKTLNLSIDRWNCATHPHPTLSEIFQEALHAASGTPLHSI